MQRFLRFSDFQSIIFAQLDTVLSEHSVRQHIISGSFLSDARALLEIVTARRTPHTVALQISELLWSALTCLGSMSTSILPMPITLFAHRELQHNDQSVADQLRPLFKEEFEKHQLRGIKWYTMWQEFVAIAPGKVCSARAKDFVNLVRQGLDINLCALLCARLVWVLN